MSAYHHLHCFPWKCQAVNPSGADFVLKNKGKDTFFVLWCNHWWSILSIAETEQLADQGAGSATEVFVTWSNGLRQPRPKRNTFVTEEKAWGTVGSNWSVWNNGLLLLGKHVFLLNSEIVALFPQLEPAQFVREQSGVVIHKWPACEEEVWGVAVKNCFCTAGLPRQL